MTLIDCDLSQFNTFSLGKRLICFGVTKHIMSMVDNMELISWLKRVTYFVDNDPNKQGESIHLGNQFFEIKCPDVLKDENDAVVIITSISSRITYEVVCQLEQMGLKDNIKVFSLYIMENHINYDNSLCSNMFSGRIDNRIDKKIHFFWIGGEKPEKIKECIQSWKKYCFGYEIIEWNDKNYDVKSNKYIRQAYEAGKWAFVSDYVRLDVLYKYGGIYLDCDVEVLRSLDDLLRFKSFMSFEKTGLINIGSGFGAEKGFELIKKLMDQYQESEFLSEGSSYSSKNVIMQPMRQIKVFEEFGYTPNGKTQIIDDVAFLSPDYINTVADVNHSHKYLRGKEYLVHWTHASWYDDDHIKERTNDHFYRDKLYNMNWKKLRYE